MRARVGAVALVLVAAACGGAADDLATTTTDTEPPASTTSQPETITTAPATTQTTQATTATPSTLAGEGNALLVVGVAHDDVLNLRSGPGVDYEIVATIEPLSRDVISLGTTRDIGTAFWTLIDHRGSEGWVNLRFLAYEADPRDATSTVIDEIYALPSADSMEELGRLVANVFASVEPPSDIVMTESPSAETPNEVIFDVIGLGDDSVYGVRLAISARVVDDVYELVSVEATDLCLRGSENGICL